MFCLQRLMCWIILYNFLFIYCKVNLRFTLQEIGETVCFLSLEINFPGLKSQVGFGEVISLQKFVTWIVFVDIVCLWNIAGSVYPNTNVRSTFSLSEKLYSGEEGGNRLKRMRFSEDRETTQRRKVKTVGGFWGQQI